MVQPLLPAPNPRRISYVLPLPSSSPPILSLPPAGLTKKGRIGPLYTSKPASKGTLFIPGEVKKDPVSHPRHRLAVQALAIDLSTSLHGENTPGGLLYTGGRDGLVCSWELGLPTKRRKKKYGKSNLHEEESGSGEDDNSDSEGENKERASRSDFVDPKDLEEMDPIYLSSRGKESRGLKGRRDSSSYTTRGFEKEEAFSDSLAVEERYEVDDLRTRNSSLPVTRFRQCVQSHTDWVNDIVLCDYNRTLVSASSDSLLLAWNPHSTNQEDQVCPKKIGTHGDYIRCLTGARDAGWVASGGFDRKIKIWDLAEGRSNAVVELPSPPASIYSIAATPSGSLLAAGTPERVIRIWDPRSRRQVARLGGHTDNVRGVLLGDDGKWLLSASSDTTVKLWSLAAQKCLHTFSHHSTSVWSLFSQHPNLEIFYSGDRSGNVCKIDIEGSGDPGDGECIVLARDAEEAGEPRSGGEGITQLVAQDDSWVWTAGGSSSVKRWRDVPPRRKRAGAIIMRESIEVESETPPSSHQSPIVAESPTAESTYIDRDRSGLPSVSFIEGLTTTLSRTSSTPTPRAISIYSGSQFKSPRPTSLRAGNSNPLTPTQRSTRFNPNSGTSTPGFSSTIFEIPYDSLVPLTSPDDPYFSHALSSRNRDPDSATIYSTVSIPSASIPSRPSLSNSPPSQMRPHSLAETILEGENQAANSSRREYTEREAASEATPLRSTPDEIIEGGHGLTRCELLNDRRHALSLNTEGEVALWDVVECTCIGIFSSEELLSLGEQFASESGSAASSASSSKDLIELIKERIEGEISVPTWCKCDTRVGALTVHLEEARAFDAEVYSDESHLGPNFSFTPDHRIILGKWVLRNLFARFIDAEVELRSPTNLPRTPAPVDHTGAPTFISLSDLPNSTSLSRQPKTPGMTIALATPAVRPAVPPELPLSPPTSAHRPPLFDLPPPLFSQVTSGPGTPRLGGLHGSGTPTGARTPTSFRTEGDYFSLLPTQESPTSSLVPLKTPDAPAIPSPAPTPGLMNRFRFGKSSKRPNTGDALAITTIAPVVPASDLRIFDSVEEEQQYRILEAVLSRPLNPCSSIEAPYLPYEENMAVIISEETDDASAWAVTYRGLVGTGRDDLPILEQKAPHWLLDFLLGDRIPQKDPMKIAFVLQPWIDPIRAGLPNIPNAGNTSRLTANRTLRISKVVGYVADKLDLRHPSTSRAPSISSFVASTTPKPLTSSRGPVMDDFDPSKLEILCGDVVLPTRMSIATTRAYYWKSGGDIVLSYRLASINNIHE